MPYPDDIKKEFLCGAYDDAIEAIYETTMPEDIIIASEFADALDDVFFNIIHAIVKGEDISKSDALKVRDMYDAEVLQYFESKGE